MADYRTTVDVEITNANKLDSLEAKIKRLENKKVTVGISTDGEEALNNIIKNINRVSKSKGIDVPVNIDSKSIARTQSQIEKRFSKIKFDVDFGNVESELNNALNRVNKLGSLNKFGDTFSNKMQMLVSDARDLKIALDDAVDAGDVSSAIRNYDNLSNTIKKITSEAKRAKSELDISSAQSAVSTKRTAVQQSLDAWLSNNPKVNDSIYGDQIAKYKIQVDTASSVQEIDALNKKILETERAAKLAGVTGQTWVGKLVGKAREVAEYLTVFTPMWEIQNGIQMMAQNVLDVDTAMTGLYRVTELTDKQYNKLYSDMISASKEYGSTLTDTINATADWVRAGFDANDALGLANVTAMYQHVSDLDYNEASANLLTAYNGFKDSFNQEFGGDAVASVEHIADAFNELDNQYSVTSAGLGEGLARSASALQLAGNTFEEAAA